MPRKIGFTLVELMIVIAVIMLLAGILIPVVFAAVGKGKKTACMVKMHEVSIALSAYYQDHKMYPNPANGDPMQQLIDAKLVPLSKEEVICPADEDQTRFTYSPYYNYWGFDQSSGIKQLTSLAEAKAVYNDPADPLKRDLWSSGLNGDGPSHQFPGLANSAAPAATIVTVCGNHDKNKASYNILRLDGTVNEERVPPSDDDYWMLSKRP